MDENTKNIAQLRTYVLDFQKVLPTPFQYFSEGAQPLFPMTVESDRGVGMLLYYSALKQGISEKKIMQLLGYLWMEYSSDLFKLNRLPFDELQGKVNAFAELNDWEFLPKAPGILRSVNDFFYNFGKIIPWVNQIKDAESCVHTLSNEIFMMGKTSLSKSKARNFIWLLTQLPSATPQLFWSKDTILLPTAGHARILQEFGPLKDRKRSPWKTPEQKRNYFNRFYQLLFPNESWKIYTAFDLYLKPEESFLIQDKSVPTTKVWQCKIVLQGCLNCVLAPNCPGREDV